MSVGTIFNIQRFSLHDGPGIRTTVFLKGCPLNCLWCHNPESKSIRPQLAWARNRCVGCGRCDAVCENEVHGHDEAVCENSVHEHDKEVCENGVHRHDEMICENEGHGHAARKTVAFEKCITCGKCVEVCPTMALEIMGRRVSAEEVMDEVLRDIPFYTSSGGGMTLSGGEPAMQPEFAAELLCRAKSAGIHTAIETAGHIDWSVYERFLPYLDLVLFDSKQMNAELHQKYTGQSNKKIHENLRNFCGADKNVEVIVRTPVIPGYNDDRENFAALAEFLKSMERVPKVELLPYNTLAGSKHPRLGMVYELEVDEKGGTAPAKLCRILLESGIDAIVAE